MRRSTIAPTDQEKACRSHLWFAAYRAWCAGVSGWRWRRSCGSRGCGRHAVVGHDPLDHDAVAREPGECPLEEGDRAGLAFVRQDLGVGRRVASSTATCRYSQPTPRWRLTMPERPAGDTVADAGDAAELLGVDVDQLAWLLALVAQDRGGRIELLEGGPDPGGAGPCRRSRAAGRGGGRSRASSTSAAAAPRSRRRVRMAAGAGARAPSCGR